MKQNPSFFERYAAIIKMAVIGILILLLLIPSSMVQSIITERSRNQDDVQNEISSKWGTNQTISGPIVTIPFYKYIKLADNKVEKEKNFIHLLPENLEINGGLDTSTLKRGIYEVVAYNTALDFKGSFNTRELAILNINYADILWKETVLNLGITDLGGIRDNIKVTWDTSKFNFNPGLSNRQIINSGVSAPINIKAESTVDFSFVLDINGSDDLHFLPVGKETKVNLKSKCPNPSFQGDFPPVNRNVTESGFTANWKVLHLNRNFPQTWVNSEQQIYDSYFGVSLMLDVDHYQKTMRSAKYAILFIAMTFLTFFFIEVLNKKKIHPIQYILIGLVLVLFYVLLLSFSEQIGFDLAYSLPSFSCIIKSASSLVTSKKLEASI